MDNENEFNYSSDNHFRQTTPKKKSSFGSNVVLPFISGAVGACLVMGVCFGVPNVKNALIGEIKTTSPVKKISAPTKKTDSYSAESIANYSSIATEVASSVLPSIVGIEITYTVNSFWGNSQATATGSGIIISEDGYIITNNHVVSTQDSSSYYYSITESNGLKVKLYNDDKEYDAKIVGTDAYTDLAVIKIDATGLTPAVLGNSDNTQVGEFVMAIGNPLGMDFSVTAGIVSAVNREVNGSDGNTYLAIQTDAAINSGNSGGALVNSNGEVIGINNLKLSGTGIEGIGFAIPINSTTDVVSQLIEFKTVKRPYIGISGQAIDSTITEIYGLPTGISVKSVEENSPAEKAGIKKGDIILKIEDKEVSTVAELNKIKYTYKIGDTVTLTILRNGKEEKMKVTLGEEPLEEKTDNTKEEVKTEEQNQDLDFPSIWDFFQN